MPETKRYKILVVDDDPDDRDRVKIGFGRLYDFYFAKDTEQLRRVLHMDYTIDLILLDLVLDNRTGEKIGLSLIPEIQAARPNIPIIVITADTDARTARAALKTGADDFLIKADYNRQDWEEVFQKALKIRDTLQEHKVLKTEVQRFREREDQEYAFIGNSKQIAEIKRTLQIVSEESDVTVLILGETGTGKEVAARYLHRQGVRRDKPFIAVNLSAIQETLLESTLFGSVKGAYTGATRDTEGYFRQANNGILMLDEIGDINQDIQIKLLRFLENRLIRPVGSDKDVKLNVQIIAATHHDLAAAVQRGTFRADLYQRLKALTIEMPPLRERRDDIFLILQHYLGPKLPYENTITPSARKMLHAYEWIGNVRELRNTVNHALLQLKIQQKPIIDEACLPAEIRNYRPLSKMQHIVTDVGHIETKQSRSREAELSLLNLQKIEAALQLKNKVKKDAAKDLGYKSADSLLYALKTIWQQHPGLFEDFDFPYIRASYKQIFN